MHGHTYNIFVESLTLGLSHTMTAIGLMYACQHLQYLYRNFSTWPLTMMAVGLMVYMSKLVVPVFYLSSHLA